MGPLLWASLVALILFLQNDGSLGLTQKLPDNFVRTVEFSDYYRATWEVDFSKKTVTFEVEAKTTGYVGFGLSSNGGMKGADIVIGGVYDNGTIYFDDRYGTGPSVPEIDPVQNWILISASENHDDQTTSLKFSRDFTTCDENDVAITEDTVHVIYAIGKTDSLKRHSERGVKAVNILDPPNPPVNTDNFNEWNVIVETPLPNDQEGIYWCTLHKTPKFQKKAHIVGFRVILDTPEARKYNHHLVLHRCIPPVDPNVNLTEILEPWVNQPGGDCGRSDDGVHIGQLFKYCKTYNYVWAKGGDPLFFPEHVGFPIGEVEDTSNYFILQIHYDNPDKDQNIKYKTGITVYHTHELRQHDGGFLMIGHDVHPTILVPPNTKDFVIVGHCPSDCTDLFPETGINIFNVLLHSHLNGRKLKLRHFRDGKELPWIAYDDNYDFNYQQNRPLLKEAKLQKGDHLSYECTYDSTWQTPPTNVTLGGGSTRHEMCNSFALYYPLMTAVDSCLSKPDPFEKFLATFGIQNYTNGKALAPSELAGMSLVDILNTRVDWTEEFKEKVQTQLRYGDHKMICLSYAKGRKLIKGDSMTRYPEITETYTPTPDEACTSSTSSFAWLTSSIIICVIIAIFGLLYLRCKK